MENNMERKVKRYLVRCTFAGDALTTDVEFRCTSRTDAHELADLINSTYASVQLDNARVVKVYAVQK